ncbi:MAG TPA: biotin transporter BioY [Candidatus Limnocylindria bacterium]|nr:biotin transporter BioY [Candidatus Limnocylindria bacterium]
MSAVRSLTLSDVALPRPQTSQQVLLIVGASLFTALAAQLAIAVPWSVVPISGQSFAVLLCGAVLGARRAFIAQLLYLAEGVAGMPVFAGGAAGVIKLVGPTGGYLIAFPFAAAVTGALAERGWDRRFSTMLAAMLLGSGVIFALGLAGLSRFVPAESLLATGLWPFIPGDLIKSSLAALAFPRVWRWVGKRGGSGA